MLTLKLDLHVHTVYSGDSLISLRDLIRYAKLKGLEGLAITDHKNLKAYRNLKKTIQEEDFIIIPGMEIKTHIGEVLGLFIDDEIKTKDNNFYTVVNSIKDNNGLVVIPHPFDFLRSNHLKMNLLTDNIIKKYIDGVEILNSRIIFKRCVDKARKFNQKHQLFETGGSDAHTKKEIGNGYTLITDVNEKTYKSIKNSLLSKKSKSIGSLSSPFVHFATVFNKLKKGEYFKK